MGKRRCYKKYSARFKYEALKRSSEDAVTDYFVCKELGVNSRQLRHWRDELRLLGDDKPETLTIPIQYLNNRSAIADFTYPDIYSGK